MTDREWLDSLKVGDVVAQRHSSTMSTYFTIERLTGATKHQLRIGMSVFRRRDGVEPGHSYHPDNIEQITDEIRAAAKRTKVIWAIERLHTSGAWKKLCPDRLDALRVAYGGDD